MVADRRQKTGALHRFFRAKVCNVSRTGEPHAGPRPVQEPEAVTLGRLLEEPLLRSATLCTGGEEALDRLVGWCLPWSVATRGSEGVQQVLVHLAEEPSDSETADLCRAISTLAARGAAGVAINGAEPCPDVVRAAGKANLPLLALPDQTSHLALSRLVAEKNLANEAHVLQYGVTVHHALGEVLYRGAGLSAMTNQVRRLSDCSVLLLDTQLEALVTDRVDQDLPSTEEIAAGVREMISSGQLVIDSPRGRSAAVELEVRGRELTVVTAPIVLGGTNYGWLLLIEREHPPRRHDLAQHLVLAGEAATITGSEMLRLRSVEAAEERARGDFVHALLHGRFSNPHEVIARASHHGFEVNATHGVITVMGAFETGTPAGLERQGSLLSSVRRLSSGGQPALATGVGDLLVVVARVAGAADPRDPAAEQESLAAFSGELHSEVRRRVQREIKTTYGRPATGADGVAASYREARVALGIAQRLGFTRPCGYSELHSYAALTDLTTSSQALTFSNDVLAPLRGRESAGEDLLKVVLTYIECGGNVNAAARKLHLHRNTMFYKLERASRLLQLDVRESEAMFTIWLAHRIDLLAAVEADVAAELGTGTDDAAEE